MNIMDNGQPWTRHGHPHLSPFVRNGALLVTSDSIYQTQNYTLKRVHL